MRPRRAVAAPLLAMAALTFTYDAPTCA